MKILLSWLNEFADFGHDVDRLAERLTSLGLAVEGVELVGNRVDGVVVARVLRTEKHPDAAKVTRVWVDGGDGVERHVWCGATNMKAGDLVPLATLGVKMPDGREINRRGILGIDSEGMLCSGRELGLDEESSGLKILPPHLNLGANVFDALGIEPDVVFDLDVTRNRPDCFGHLGVARDLAASLGVTLHPRGAERREDGPEVAVDVSIATDAPCTRFEVIVIDGVRVTTSPEWIVRRLLHAGMRSINNIVDVSNLVNLELNQPNHAYDLRQVKGGFIVRLSRPDESIVTLDGVQRTLDVSDMLICNADDEPVGIAGIMGGFDSEVTDTTSSLAVEIAHFDSYAIARSASRLGLRTEASLRFERGVDPHSANRAFDRFVELLSITCPEAKVRKGIAGASTASLIGSLRLVHVRLSEIERVLGVTLNASEVRRLLEPIGFAVGESDLSAEVGIPSFRPDCSVEIDVIEEVARHYGYERLGKAVPKSPVFGVLSEAQRRRRLLHEVVLGLGLSEAMPNPFLAPGDLALSGIDESDALQLANPLVAEESVLRTSLRPGLLKTIVFNQSHRVEGIRMFEMGHVYPQGEGELPDEFESLCLVGVGVDARVAMHWWNEISASLEVGAQLDQEHVPAGFHATRSALLSRGKSKLGAVGEIDPDVLASFGVQGRVACLELNASVICGESPKVVVSKHMSRFPPSDFDLAFLAHESVPAALMMRAIRQAGGALLEHVRIFDVYHGADLPGESRSVAFRVRLRASDRTLTDDEVAQTRLACIGAVAKVGGQIRQ